MQITGKYLDTALVFPQQRNGFCSIKTHSRFGKRSVEKRRCADEKDVREYDGYRRRNIMPQPRSTVHIGRVSRIGS